MDGISFISRVYDYYAPKDFYYMAIEKIGLIEVTLWYRPGNKYNHLETGHHNGRPEGHPSWRSGEWLPVHSYARFIDGVLTVV